MTCKDCIHYDVCNMYDGSYISVHLDHTCEHFKDKSLIVELPCKMGDAAYYISIKRYSPLSYKLVKAKVIDFYISENGIYAVELKTSESNFTFTLNICKVYFDKSKAEAKLKELNEK